MSEHSSDEQSRRYESWYQDGSAHWESSPGKSVFISLLQQCLPADEPNALVDIGCGTGVFLQRVFDEVSTRWELHGVDFAPTAIEVGRRHPGFHFLCSDATTLEYPPASFDTVCCYGSWEHFEDPRKAIREASRILRPGGWVIALLPTLGIYRADRDDEGWYEDLEVAGYPERQMQWNWRRTTWEAVFTEAGFGLEDDGLALKCGAIKPGVFYFGRKSAGLAVDR